MTSAPALPAIVWIGAYEFACEVREANDKIFDGGAMGITHFASPRGIYLSATNRPLEQLGTLMHELTHAICYSYTIKVGAKLREEALCDKFGTAWAALFIDNPKLYRWINWSATQIRREQKRA